MKRPPPPHEVLGIARGADRQTVDAAYRRLIKQHHPDAGGDPEQAKSVIHAYRSLVRNGERLPVMVEAPPVLRDRRRRWPALLAGGLAAAMLWWAPLSMPEWPKEYVFLPGSPAIVTGPRPLAPLLLERVAPDLAAVEAGVQEAKLLAGRPAATALSYSRSCAADLERLPGDALLDHCVGFDLAARVRAGGGPWWNEAALARRHSAAALTILEDPVLAEARLREIRRQVERQLVEQPLR